MQPDKKKEISLCQSFHFFSWPRLNKPVTVNEPTLKGVMLFTGLYKLESRERPGFCHLFSLSYFFFLFLFAMAAVSESRYRSILKPVKFWQRSNKTVPVVDEEGETIKPIVVATNEDDTVDNNNATTTMTTATTTTTTVLPSKSKPKLSIHTPFSILKKSAADPRDNVALVETAKGQVYKLSTINDSGVYLPPSPCEDGKHDHWLDIDQETMAFRLPSPDRLTTHSGEGHCFHTPSATINLQPSLVEKN